ncbi:MAG: HYR domain-containing protein [Blastocatellales bacterium]
MPSLRQIEKIRAIRQLLPLIAILVFALIGAFALIGKGRVSGQVTITDINPNQSTLDPSDADGASGGRVNGLAAVPGNNQIFYAATEWGGLYRSNDAGANWNRLNNHGPTVTWDVEVSPANANLVFATSFYDGRVNSQSGINVSTDGGANWTHPATATPPVGMCAAARRNEPAAFGIAIDPANAQNVYVGTNCGLAISNDGGTTWNFVDPTPGDLADDIWDVVVHHGGIIDVVGDDGHRRSITGGASWTTATGTPLPSGRSSIAASPDEQNVIFATVGNNVWESDDGGANWTNLGTPDSRRQGRIPFVAVNDRAGNGFDLWYGDVRLYRGGCTSNPMGGGLRCPMATVGNPLPAAPPAGWNGPFTRDVGGHDDVGDIVFDSQAANDACPRIFASDGGVYFNTVAASPACHTPAWEQPNQTPHATWLWSLAGADQAGNATEDLYFGLQDNGSYAATNAGAANPAWSNVDCCDIFDTAAEPARVLYTFCCGGAPNRATRVLRRGSGMAGGGNLNDPADYPADGIVPGFIFPDVLHRFGNASYALITTDCIFGNDGIDNDGDGTIDEPDEIDGGCSGTNNGDGGIYITTNAAASPVAWAELGPATEPPTGGNNKACAIKSATMAGTTTFFAQVGRCDGRNADQLWSFTGTNPAGTWTQVNLPPGGIGIFDVDPNNPNRIIASQLNAGAVNMVLTTNGGTNWNTLAALDNLMTGGGTFQYRNTRGSRPGRATSHDGYVQPTLAAFDPNNGNTIVAGGADSGVFISTDAGNIWTTLTDNSGGAANPHLPRPRYAYFDREGGTTNLFIGTQGRGVWRINFPDANADLQVTKMAAPNPVVTGTNVTYTITVRNNGPDAAQSVMMVDNLPASVSFVSCAVNGGVGGACGGAGNNRTATFTSLAANASATVTLVAQVSCALANNTMISNTAGVSSLATDPNLGNNSAMVNVTASNPPPVITCPPNQNAVTPNVGDMSAMVAYPPPMVVDNCPGAVAVCVPPSGSVFPLGVTNVTCTATDSGGAMANCNFKVTVWDVCLQDDKSGDILFFNSFTGDYLFIRCATGLMLTGKGMITRVGCLTTLTEARVTATLDHCIIAPLNRGSATIKPNPIGGWFFINDSNTENNTCVCP